MVRSLYFGALALGLVAWVCSLLLAPRRATKTVERLREWIPLVFGLAAVGVPLLALSLSFVIKTPSMGGHKLGLGLLLGSIGSGLTLLTLARGMNSEAMEETGEPRSSVACVAPFALAVVVVAVPLIWMRNSAVDTLFGIALGWLTSTLLLLAGLNAPRSGGRATGLVLTTGAGFAAALCGIGAIGEMGGNVRVGSGLAGVPWSAPLLLVAGSMVFVLLLCALPPNLLRLLPGAKGLLRASSSLNSETAQQAAPQILRWLVGGLLFVSLGAQFGHRLGGQPDLFRLLGMGVAASGLAWWMLAGQSRTIANGGMVSGGWLRLAMPVLVIMAAGMVAFQMLSGVGFAIMLLGAWLTMGISLLEAQQSDAALSASEYTPASPAFVSSQLLQTLLFGSVLLLYRLFQVRFRNDLQNVLMPDHYALLGFIIGAAVPAALAQYAKTEKEKRRKGEEETSGQNSSLIPLLRMLIAGVLLLFVPGVLLMLFGTKCLLCLFFGLALATVIGESSGQGQGERDGNTSQAVPSEWLTGLFALGIGLAVAQWTAHVLPVTLMARADKTRLLTHLTGVVAVVLFVAGLFGRTRRATVVTQKGGAK